MTELKPCPFCGGEVNLYSARDPKKATMIACIDRDCFAMVSMCTHDEEETIRRWNKRVGE